MQRKSAILLAANSHFAHHGFRGASLRDIARDAEVSLTLLNHHFGSKSQLLAAVIEAHRKVLDDRANIIRALMAVPEGSGCVDDVVTALVCHGFETAAQPDGETFLRLVARVIDDPEEEAVQVVRERLDDGALLFIDALLRRFPHASRYTAATAYVCFNAALLKFLIGSRRLLRLAHAESPTVTPHRDAPVEPGSMLDGADADAASPMPAPAPYAATGLREDDQARIARFLVAGIEAVMRQHGV